MIIPNIEALSISELQFIAKRYGIENGDQLAEDDLREALHELFEEFGTEYSTLSALYSPSNQKRYFNQIYESPEDFQVGSLPGVQELPPFYSETAIHLLLKDPSWAHAYWSIGPNDFKKLSENSQDPSFFLRVFMCDLVDGNLVDSFDIPIAADDISWNVNLPEHGRSFYISLMYQYDDEEVGVLATSNTIATRKPYFQDHIGELEENEDDFYLLFSSLVTKGGVLVDSRAIHEIFTALELKRELA